MTQRSFPFVALLFAAAACSPEATTSESEIPAELAAAAMAAAPGITLIGGEANPAGDQYEITATTPDGDEIELDLTQSNGVWSVLEIQRDIAWSTVPAPVRAAAAASPDAFEPIRVIESRQIADGSIVYELFQATADASAPRGPAMEVRWHEDSAAILP